jgi:hypothetical protein
VVDRSVPHVVGRTWAVEFVVGSLENQEERCDRLADALSRGGSPGHRFGIERIAL